MAKYIIQYRNSDGRNRFVRDLKDDQKLFVETDLEIARRIAAQFKRGRVIDITQDANVMLIR